MRVYLTTKDKVFLNLNDALECQKEEEKEKEKTIKKRETIMKVYKIISEILSKNEWGIYFKGEPLQVFPVQEGAKMYKVNDVNPDKLYDAIETKMKEVEDSWEQNTKEEPTDNESSVG